METIKNAVLAVKAKWDALAPATKFLVVATVAVSFGVALFLS